MTLQALKAAEFESSSLRVVPVTPGQIDSLSELPLLSYAFRAGEEEPFKVFYDITPKRDDSRHLSPNNFRTIAKQLINGASGLGLQLVDGDSRWWDNPIHFVSQTMQNMTHAKMRADSDNRRQDGAAIHGLGAVYVPLGQGASMVIKYVGDTDQFQSRWDTIVSGEINFFGEARPFSVYHPHCQGFTLPAIDVVMEEVIGTLFKWFPFLDGHVAVIHSSYVTNPISHQDRL